MGLSEHKMKIIRFLAIFLIAVTPPIFVVMYYGWIDFPQLEKKPEQQQKVLTEKDRYNIQIEKGFAAFNEFYQQEFNIYKQEITSKWGEFIENSPSSWISYEKSNNIRRSVDYKTGEVKVEMLVNRGTKIDQVKGEVDKAVFRLMNSTEKEAYKTDVVANRVEQKLAEFEDILQKGELTDNRLFSLNDLLSLQINHDGYLKAWYQAGNVAFTNIIDSAKADKEIVRVSFKIPHSIHQKAVKYAAVVNAASKKENINDELIYAIMETESSFNPMAKSPIPAYGLMQIVPNTAGKDATNYLYGKAKILAPSFLFKPENNINIGTAYLHVLQYKYMRRIKNDESRLYCAIAAYNTGSSNVAKAFINQASFNKAVPVINKLSAQEVFYKLKKYLPRKESRNYIEKVSKRMEKYL